MICDHNEDNGSGRQNTKDGNETFEYIYIYQIFLSPVQMESYKCYEDLLSTSIEIDAKASTKVAADQASLHFNSDDIAVSTDGT